MSGRGGGVPGELLLRREFGRSDLPLVRHLVTEGAILAGLSGPANGAFVQAALEIATNAVLHGGGHGSIELRLVEDELRCEVMDGGPGLPERSEMAAGHGLRLAEALTGRLELHSGPDQRGTVAALAVRVRS
ncbi:ATP-binding protein [Streptomyces sp. S.PB5]|uniref:ATP-binding protein n=1 Tax=Streptomyces sp. S.PB5 TaxID=3020844 RepID=UPI0025B1317E|nr:ATP-binding protein [Streptomyces sp. S.PB5]MDN3020418.1 ATP-binding protein [Streptomyces sp. S.PB5]